MKQRFLKMLIALTLIAIMVMPTFAATTSANVIAQAYINRIRATTFQTDAFRTTDKPVIFYELTGDDLPEMILVARENSYTNKFQIFTFLDGETKLMLESVCGFASAPYDCLYVMKDGTVGLYSSNCGGGAGEPQYNIHYGATYKPAVDGTFAKVSSYNYEYFQNPNGTVSIISGTVNGKAVTESEVQRAENSFIANRAVLLVDSKWDSPSAHSMSRNDAIAYLNRINGQFFDVLSGAYYADAVDWAVQQGVTDGTSTYRFSPDATCTRAQVVTFLWRAIGSPEPKTVTSPFSDVTNANAYYYKAVLWAVENGITSGTSQTTFSPDAPCTRAQVVTFLWRTAGMPEPAAGSNPFGDVRSGAYYYKAVLWAVQQKVTAGTTATAFSPDAVCTRGQIVTFLYRAKDLEAGPTPETGWSEAYQDFVMKNRFLNAGQSYSNDAGFFTAGLYDMDRDGTPELIISNGGAGRVDRWAYIYTYDSGSVQYLAIGPSEAYYDPGDRSGIYGRFSTMDGENWTKYEKSGSSITTSSAGSFPTFSGHTDFICLPISTTAQIRESGWTAFLSSQDLP